jgi:alpha-ketoglutarate-dependent taurine dioxygenase
MSTYEARDLCPAIGAEITGIDVNRSLDDDEVAFLRGVYDARGLLLFRGIDDGQLDRTRQAYLCELLNVPGEPPSDEYAAELAGRQPTFTISNKVPAAAAPFGALMYHCDGMWSPHPFEVISLLGVELQDPVTPTLFASAGNAWATLPDDLRARVQDLKAEHVSGPEFVHPRRRVGFEGQLVQATRDHIPSHVEPVAFTHPRTGQTLLYVTQGMTRGIVGMDPDESEDLLEEVFEHMYRPENVLTFDWHVGDLVVWDNYVLQHARPDVTTEGPARTLRKIGLPMMPADIAAALVASYDPVEN